MSIRAKWIALMLAVVLMLVGMQVYYGGNGSTGRSSGQKATAETTYEWWIYSGTSTEYYDTYGENPSVQYTLQKGYGPENKKIAINFLEPPAGTEADNYTRMLASGDLPDIIDAVISDPPRVMVEKGYCIELTEYVEQYMPNYVALVHSDNEIYINTVEVDDDGNEHYYAIFQIYDAPETIFQGYMYRRDWLVKYGTNPATGEAFTGGYTAPDDVDSWEDDVVFPSWCDAEKQAKGLELVPEWDGTYPLFISDWEWMFEIFEAAQKDLGITDKYCISLYYPGYTWSGGLLSCFGGGVNVWYQDAEGKVHFGGYEEPFKTYLQCMNTWYSKGWLDQDFMQRTSDAFYRIDSTSVRQGLIAMWNGQQSELGGRLDMHDGGYTEGIYAAAAPYPINDIYGSESCRYVTPNCVMGGGLVSGGVLVTTAAKDKDLATLCAYLDQFYSMDGALIKTVGLSAEQAASLTDSTFYADYGLEDGAYFANEDGQLEKSPVLASDSGQLATAAGFSKAPGLKLNAGLNQGYAPNFQKSLEMWSLHENTAFFQGSRTTNAMSQDDTSTYSAIMTKVLDYMNKNCANFITGKSNFEKDWDKWCTVLKKYKVDQITELLQPYVDKYPFR